MEKNPPSSRVYCTQNHKELILTICAIIIIKCPNFLRRYFIFIRLLAANKKYNSLIARLICRKIPSQARKYRKFKTYVHTSSEFRSKEPKTIYTLSHRIDTGLNKSVTTSRKYQQVGESSLDCWTGISIHITIDLSHVTRYFGTIMMTATCQIIKRQNRINGCYVVRN